MKQTTDQAKAIFNIPLHQSRFLLPLKDTPASGDHHACCNQVPTGSVQISIPSLLAILALLSFNLC